MISENIQYLRKQQNMTQEALAEKIGVAQQTVAKWECGESTPDLQAAGQLSQVFNVPLDELVRTSMVNLHADDLRGKYMFGLVTIGDKGQIVIPVRARRVFNLKPGDQLMVLGDETRGLALMDARFFVMAAEVMKRGSEE